MKRIIAVLIGLAALGVLVLLAAFFFPDALVTVLYFAADWSAFIVLPAFAGSAVLLLVLLACRRFDAAMDLIACGTAAACLFALAISIYPGALNTMVDVGMFLTIAASPILFILFAAGLIALWRAGILTALRLPTMLSVRFSRGRGLRLFRLRCVAVVNGRRHRIRLPWMRALLVPVMLVGTLGLLRYYIPRRIAFIASQSVFERIATAAVPSQGGAPLGGSRVGWFRVEEYTTDESGGVYFLLFTRMDGPDLTSYGFTLNPDRAGSPYGGSYYRLFRLRGGWYWFRAEY